MACPTVTTGSRFLTDTLNYLDCQAQTIGSFGFQALAAPGSPASLALSGLLTLFIALFAIRLLFTSDVEPRDAVGVVLKIGVVLTLAVSWPAFRTLAYETVLKAPAEMVATITPSSLPDSGSGFAERLQNIDSGIAALTAVGVGRQTGSLELEDQPQRAFRAIALQDETAFGWARTLFLGSVIGSLAILRIGGGLLLALTPIFSGLLLFEFSRGLFAGWFRGLSLVALGSLGMTVVLGVEVALLEPWLVDVLNRRSLGYATPTAPTELLALTLSFGLASAGILFLLAKVAFQNAWPNPSRAQRVDVAPTTAALQPRERLATHTEIPVHSRALQISESMTSMMRREELSSASTTERRGVAPRGERGPDQTTRAAHPYSPEPLGDAYRRNARRQTGSQTRRDGTR